MSLGVVIKGPEGVVLAADSRVTLQAQKGDGIPFPVNYDNATKLFSFTEPHNFVGIVTYGLAALGLRTAHSFIPEFEVKLLYEDRYPIKKYAEILSDLFMSKWSESIPEDYQGPPMTFIVGGYDEDAPYGKVYMVAIPSNPSPVPRNVADNEFGMTWGGQLEFASRIINGFDPRLPSLIQQKFELTNEQVGELFTSIKGNLEYRIPYQVLPLQDCVDLATFMIQTTMIAQDLSVGVRGVGGPIDVATITRTQGIRFIKRKTIHV